MNWDKLDELIASFARPWQMYLCGTAVAFSAVWSVIYAHDVVIITVPAATTVATGIAYMRTMEKKAEVAKAG